MTRGWLTLSMQRFSRGSRGTHTPLSSFSRIQQSRFSAQYSGAVSSGHNAVLCMHHLCPAIYPKSSSARQAATRAHIFLPPVPLVLFPVTAVGVLRFPCRGTPNSTIVHYRRETRERQRGRLCAFRDNLLKLHVQLRDRDFRVRGTARRVAAPRKIR